MDTSACGFTTTLLSLNGFHWRLTGIDAIYNASPTGFSIFLRWTDDSSSPIPLGSTNEPHLLIVSTAMDKGWSLRWTGIHARPCSASVAANHK